MGEKEKEFLVNYLIEDNNYHRFMLVVPGGAYQGVADYNEGKPFVPSINKAGYHAFVLFYGVKEKAAYPNPINDIAKALKIIFENKDKYKVDTTDYIIVGSSAGAHMTQMFSLESIGYKNYGIEKPYGLILAYPVVTMRDYTHHQSRATLLGENPTSEMINKTSIELNVTSDFPKTYLFCGKNDLTVNPLNSINLKEALDRFNVKNMFRLFENAPHGCSLGETCDAKGWLEEAIKFMNTKE